MKSLFKAFYYLFIVALIGVGGLLLLTHAPLSNKMQMKIVQSGSMTPSIQVGSVVVIVPHAPYEVGDVITFTSERMNMPVTHRVFAKDKASGRTFYITKGDANEEPDLSQVPEKNVIGKVMLTIPYLGYIIDFARKPMGFIFLIGIPAMLVILDELLVIAGEVRAWRGARRQRAVTQARRGRQPSSIPIQKPEVILPRTRIQTIPVSMDGIILPKIRMKRMGIT